MIESRESNKNSIQIEDDSSDEGTKLYYVWVDVHETLPQASFLIDTGAAVSIISKLWYDKIPSDQKPELKPSPCPLRAGNDTRFVQYGCVTLKFHLHGLKMKHKFWVVDTPSSGILGLDFLQNQGAVIDNGRCRLTINDVRVRLYNSAGKPLHNKVVAERTIYLAPGRECIVRGRVCNHKVVSESEAVIEPAGQVFDGTGAIVAKVAVDVTTRFIPVRLYNPCDWVVTVYKNTTLGVLSEIMDVVPVIGKKTKGQKRVQI